jgi:hypothetical protein
MLSPRFQHPGIPWGHSRDLGRKAAETGKDHVRVRGRSSRQRLAKQIAAPKQTSPVQSTAAARPLAAASVAHASQNPLLPPRKQPCGLGRGESTRSKAQERRGPPRNPNPVAAGSAESKILPPGECEPLHSSPPLLCAQAPPFVQSLRSH